MNRAAARRLVGATIRMGEANLRAMLAQADAIDFREGLAAYRRYHHILCEISRRYSLPLDRTVAVFVSLSPNSDYIGNLRSTVSVAAGLMHGVPMEQVQVSTYRHCLQRAWIYATGEASFLERTKGPKVRAFYHNCLDPTDNRHVTIDGHMTAIWRGKNLTMREALVYSRREYNEIADCIKRIAFEKFMVPCELQAVLWFTRKRLFKIKHSDQFSFWASDEPDNLRPYARRVRSELAVQSAAT